MTVSTEPSDFYDAGPLKQVAINLFYGWGYNFYRAENQLRADDQLIRGKAAVLLGQTRESLALAEATHRREALPPPSRANPYPDPAAVAGAQALERMVRAVDALIGRLHALPVPENDRMTQRYRKEAETLVRLGECDERLIGQAETLRSAVDGRPASWLLENTATVEAGLAALQETLKARALLLA